MSLPTTSNYLECGPRLREANEVTGFQRLGPMLPHDKKVGPPSKGNLEDMLDKYHWPRLCPDSRRVQQL